MAAVLFVAFILVPLAEIYVIVSVGHVIGVLPTILALLVVSALGAYIVKREGVRAWRALQTALAAGRVPAREVADGVLVLAGGALLLTPGFLSDVVGLLFVLPVTRPVVRRVLQAFLFRRVLVARRAGKAGVRLLSVRTRR